MTQYNIPFNTHFEDKILGGKLTLKQGFCFLPALILVILLFSCSSMTTIVVNGKREVSMSIMVYYVLLDFILLIFGAIFAFIKINGYGLLPYMIKKTRFSMKETIIKFYK